jgi:peptide/nickel transport system permease protein
VVTQIATRLPVTMGLVTLAMLIVLLLSVPLGILSGYYHDKWPDWIIRPLMVLFIGIPEFWVGCILIMVLLMVWHWSVPLSYVTFFSNPVEAFQQYIFPSMLLALRGFGTGARMIRSSLIETMEEDYIRTARAKGLTETLVTLRHALPNSLVPVVTFYGLQIIILVGATTVIETLFGMPGVGSMIVRSAQSHDTYVLQGGIMILLIVALLMNLIIDLLYAKLDPRVRYE